MGGQRKILLYYGRLSRRMVGYIESKWAGPDVVQVEVGGGQVLLFKHPLYQSLSQRIHDLSERLSTFPSSTARSQNYISLV